MAAGVAELKAAGVAELKVDNVMAVIKSQSEEITKTLLEKGQTLERRLRDVQERPDMTERIESIERSMQVCVNSVRVLHSYAEANGSSDSDRDDT